MPVAFSLSMFLALAAGYLLGSIPFGLLLTRAAGLGDIRGLGSGNIGATNVLRTGNRWLAAATLLLDGLKGTAAVLVGALIGAYFVYVQLAAVEMTPEAMAQAVVANNIMAQSIAGGFGAFLGHVYPVWLRFKGGKGVATYIGVLFGLYWPAAAAFCLIWLVTAGITRYSSLSALLASIAAPLAIWGLGQPQIAVLLVPLSAMLIYTHRANIERLRAGHEPKIGAKA